MLTSYMACRRMSEQAAKARPVVARIFRNAIRNRAKLVAAPLGHGRACPGHPDNRALYDSHRDRRDRPGDDVTSLAPYCHSRDIASGVCKRSR
jgi:hypothetical protein